MTGETAVSDIAPASPLMPPDPLGALAPIRPPTPPGTEPGTPAENAARDFESVLLYRLLEEMRRTIPDSGLLETAQSKQMQGLFWFYLAEEVARRGGLGLWRQIHAGLGPANGAAGRAGADAPPGPLGAEGPR